jgi:hypothetical protein
VLSAHLVPDGHLGGAGAAGPAEPRGLRRDLGGDPPGAETTRSVGGGGFHLLLDVQPVIRARVLLLPDRRPRLLPRRSSARSPRWGPPQASRARRSTLAWPGGSR